MLTKRIIPCLDVTNGRVVKGTNFVNLVDAGDPVETAIAYNNQSADEIIFLDITATSDGRKSIINVIECTAEKVFTHGGRKETSLNAVEWAKKGAELGAGEILLTSMDKDGTKEGYDIELTKIVSEKINVPVIASGGAGTLEHLYEVLNKGKADAVLAASIFHFGIYTIPEAKNFLKEKGMIIRI